MSRCIVHRWRGAITCDVLHAQCVKCGMVTFSPWWPRWVLRRVRAQITGGGNG